MVYIYSLYSTQVRHSNLGFTRLSERETGSWVSNRRRRVRELGTDEPEDTDGAEGWAGEGNWDRWKMEQKERIVFRVHNEAARAYSDSSVVFLTSSTTIGTLTSSKTYVGGETMRSSALTATGVYWEDLPPLTMRIMTTAKTQNILSRMPIPQPMPHQNK